MSLNLEEQAIKPRGNNVRERFAFLIGWYRKTCDIETKDGYQIRLIRSMSTWAEEGTKMLLLSDEELVAAIKNEIAKAKGEIEENIGWSKHNAMAQYLAIELGRVIGA